MTLKVVVTSAVFVEVISCVLVNIEIAVSFRRGNIRIARVGTCSMRVRAVGVVRVG